MAVALHQLGGAVLDKALDVAQRPRPQLFREHRAESAVIWRIRRKHGHGEKPVDHVIKHDGH